MNQEQLNEIKEKHRKWLLDEPDGKHAELNKAELRGLDLDNAKLSMVELNYADLSQCSMTDIDLYQAQLSKANLSHTLLCHADLRRAQMCEANLHHADLNHANLFCAQLACADLSNTDLFGADLRGAYLRNANLHGASLIGVSAGNQEEIITLQTNEYPITYTADTMAIGCKQFLLSEWWEFDDRQIAAMDTGALVWWKVHKPLLKAWIEANPASPHAGMTTAKAVQHA